MNKFIATTLSLVLTFSVLIPAIQTTRASGNLKDFLVTAYYSPLPNQKYYMTGTYKGDIRLNGGGVRAADGTAPYNGMVAAPRTYAYGTKIVCPKYGTGIIHDRGGAILSKGNRGYLHDRLDFYAGAGDEGLARALHFGLQVVSCQVDNKSLNKVGFKLPDASAFTWARLAAKQKAHSIVSNVKYQKYFDLLKILNYSDSKEEITQFQLDQKIISSKDDQCAGCMGPGTRAQIDSIFQQINQKLPQLGLYSEDKGDEVRKLQELLVKSGHLTVQPTGYFGNQTSEALTKFQVDHNLIDSSSHRAAGYVGPGTIQSLKTIAAKSFAKPISATIANGNEPQIATIDSNSKSEAIEAVFVVQTIATTTNTTTKKVTPQITKNLALESRGEEVIILQNQLYDLGYMHEESTGYFGWTTAQAVLNYQIKNNIVSSHLSPGAAVLGPKTRSHLNTNYAMLPKAKITGKVL
jgi:peptidoglycan hydrolase-like protein with peptidoglycan-binding domain/3D (Asp-Asp-Asp) domain-containing protein